jgi:hypothetical protein
MPRTLAPLLLLGALLLVAGCNPAPPSPASTALPAPSRVPPTATARATAAATASPLPAATRMPATETRTPATEAPTLANPTSAGAVTPTPHPAAAAVLAYIEARARADVEQVQALSCPAWKSQAATEAVSFRSMNAQLDEVACSVSGADGGFTLVGCTGKIVTRYGTETREWDLAAFVWRAVDDAGAWKMCGYH